MRYRVRVGASFRGVAMNSRKRTAGSLLALIVCACASATPAPPAQAPIADVPVAAAEPCAPAASVPGEVPRLPAVKLERQTLGDGYAFTVWGLGYHLRSRPHRDAVSNQTIRVTGYIVATNLGTAPKCVVHAAGIADPEGCYAPIPAFWLGDTPDAVLTDTVKVMGFASNYAQIYDAIREFDRGGQAFVDTFWGQEIPNPLPAVGAKVTVTGNYGSTFAMASSGSESDDTMGLFSYRSMETLEPAQELATLPGVKRKPQPPAKPQP